MKCKKIYKYIAIVFMMLMLLIPNYAQAEDRMEENISTFQQVFGEEPIELEAVYGWKSWGESNNDGVYQWNVNTGSELKSNVKQGYTVWHIVKKGSTSTEDFNELLYCVKAGIGFETQENNGNGREPKKYNEMLNLIDDLETIKTKCRGSLTNTNSDVYNELLWLLDHIYIPGIDDESKKDALIKEAFHSQVPNEPEYELSDIDIEVVQQMAIWYFTNSDDTENYHLKNGTLPVLPSMYLNGNQISSIEGDVDEMGDGTGGGKAYQKDLNILFQHLTTNAAFYNTYTGAEEPNLTLNDSGVKVTVEGNKYVAGPYTVTNSETDSGPVKLEFNGGSGVTLKNGSSLSVGNEFYVQVDKNGSNAGKTFNFKITYSYDVRDKELLLADDSDNTYSDDQPIVVVTEEKKEKDLTGEFKTSENISVTVKKVWDDSDDQDGKRPESVSVQLFADEVAKDPAVTLTKDTWEYTWSDLPKYNEETGKEIKYTVKEQNPPEGYTPSYKENPTHTWTITNTHKPEETSVKVKKEWADGDNQDGIRPESVSVQLLADGEAYGTAVELNNANKWEHTWNNLPKYKGGKEIVYTVQEPNLPEGYSVSTNENPDGTWTVTNTYIPKETSVTVKKVWDDDDNRDGIRLEHVSVQLLADGQPYNDAVELNETNGWEHTWNNLPKYKKR